MSTHVAFQILTTTVGGEAVTVSPSDDANGIAEWTSAGARSQAYRVTASLRRSSANNRKYTIKIEVPKQDTQITGGVSLPVSAWKAFMSIDVTVPVFATNDDADRIAASLANTFAKDSPIYTAIATNAGFY
nr:MAG: hypothetical protein 2 [Leviviridae sp.]